MKRKSVMKMALASVMCVFVLSAFTLMQAEKKASAKWEIPEKYQTMENPYADDASLVNVGKMHYMKHCRSCHGNTGLGDGPKARSLQTAINSLTSPEFKAQSDGVMYYQSIIGRDEMPNYEGKLPDDEDRWALIMYIKTLK